MNRISIWGRKAAFSVLLFMVTIFVSALPCHSEDRVGLPLAMYALQVAAGLRIAPTDLIINVPADVATIQGAIDKVGRHGIATINVAAGTYNEKLTINSKDIIIVGVSGKDSTIIQGGGILTGDVVIRLTNNARADISGFTVRNGTSGIQVETSGMLLHESQIKENLSGVVAIGNSSVKIVNSSIHHNAAMGIQISMNSMASVDGCDSSYNNRDGILVEMTSMAWIQNSTFSHNSEFGVLLRMSANGSLTKNQIYSNPVGLNAGLTSSAFLYGGNSIYSNSGNGISINFGSSLNIDKDATGIIGSATPDNISNNGDNGIVVFAASSLRIVHATISSNVSDGVSIGGTSTGYASGGSITNNGNHGVSTSPDGVFGDGGVTISGNTHGNYGCTQGCTVGSEYTDPIPGPDGLAVWHRGGSIPWHITP